LRGRGVTSLTRETGRAIGFDEASSVLLGALAETFGLEFERAQTAVA
jgi:hypothetical protein